MIKISTLSTAFLVTLAGGPALAHIGHLEGDGSGHTHWLALAAFVGAAFIGAAVWLRGRRAQAPGTRNDSV